MGVLYWFFCSVVINVLLVPQSHWVGRESLLLCFDGSCGRQCFVSLHHGAVGGSVVCDCDISWS